MEPTSDYAIRGIDGGTSAISCCYWQNNAKFCNVCSQGLFIPSAQHIAIHCLTKNYRFCSYYLDFIECNTVNRGTHAALREQSGLRRRGRFRLWD